MLFFPQLIQFPAARRIAHRTVVNEHADGRRVKLADASGRTIEWRLELTGLTAAEWSELESLFQAVEGRLRPFTFLDPLDNLLAWSEDFSAAAWAKELGLELTPGATDPFGGAAATRVANGSGIAQALSQTLGAPSALRYCLSVYARSDSGAGITLFIGAAERGFATGASWRRIEYPSQPGGAEEWVSAGVKVSAGDAVELFGFQVEAQAAASGYKKTGAHHGVYANAHFQDDALVLTSDGPGEHSCAMRIRAAG